VSFIQTFAIPNLQVPIDVVVVGFLIVVVVEGIEEVVEVEVEVEVDVRVLEVMSVVVLVGEFPGLMVVVVLEEVVVLFVLWAATWLFNADADSVGDFDLQLK